MREEEQVAVSVYVGGIRKSMVDRLCFLYASNKTRFSHGPQAGPAFPPVVGNLYVSRTMLEHQSRETSFQDEALKLLRRRCDSISSLYFGAPTFFNAAAGTRRARICHVLDTMQGMVSSRILIGPIAYFNPFRAKTPSCLRISF